LTSVSRSLFNGRNPNIIFHIQGHPYISKCLQAKEIWQKEHSSFTAKLLSRKYVCKGLLYTHVSVCVCVCMCVLYVSLKQKLETLFPSFLSLWCLWDISDFLKYSKIFLFLLPDCSWNQ
jgi:hypothetical protein